VEITSSDVDALGKLRSAITVAAGRPGIDSSDQSIPEKFVILVPVAYTIDPIEDQVFVVGLPFSISVHVTRTPDDAAAPVIRFAADSDHGLTIDSSTGLIEGVLQESRSVSVEVVHPSAPMEVLDTMTFRIFLRSRHEPTLQMAQRYYEPGSMLSLVVGPNVANVSIQGVFPSWIQFDTFTRQFTKAISLGVSGNFLIDFQAVSDEDVPHNFQLEFDVVPVRVVRPISDVHVRLYATVDSIEVEVSPTVQSISVTGLPDGMTYTSTTRTISGAPTTTGVFDVVVRVRGATETVDTRSFRISVTDPQTNMMLVFAAVFGIVVTLGLLAAFMPRSNRFRKSRPSDRM
jgi:hypothetical protein